MLSLYLILLIIILIIAQIIFYFHRLAQVDISFIKIFILQTVFALGFIALLIFSISEGYIADGLYYYLCTWLIAPLAILFAYRVFFFTLTPARVKEIVETNISMNLYSKFYMPNPWIIKIIAYLVPVAIGILIAYTIYFLPVLPTVLLAKDATMQTVKLTKVKCDNKRYLYTTFYYVNTDGEEEQVTFSRNFCLNRKFHFVAGDKLTLSARQWLWWQVVDSATLNSITGQVKFLLK